MQEGFKLMADFYVDVRHNCLSKRIFDLELWITAMKQVPSRILSLMVSITPIQISSNPRHHRESHSCFSTCRARYATSFIVSRSFQLKQSPSSSGLKWGTRTCCVRINKSSMRQERYSIMRMCFRSRSHYLWARPSLTNSIRYIVCQGRRL